MMSVEETKTVNCNPVMSVSGPSTSASVYQAALTESLHQVLPGSMPLQQSQLHCASTEDRFDPFLPSFEPTVEERSLQQSMDVNKESLKRKLLLRRSVAELVDQGIYPPPKTPRAFAEQRRQLERAKTGDLLRKKLTLRPDRQCLVQHHILEDTNPLVESCVQQRQRQLKRSRLQENLSEHLVHRPGPLELVSANILKVEPELRNAINGKIQFTKPSSSSDDIDSWYHDTATGCGGSNDGLWSELADVDASCWSDLLSSSVEDSTLTECYGSDLDLLAPCYDTSLDHLSALDIPLSSSASPLSTECSSTSLSLPVTAVATATASVSLPSIPSPPDISPLLLQGLSGSPRIPTPPDITPLLQYSNTHQANSSSSTSGSAISTNSRPASTASRGSISKKSKPKIGTKSKVIKFHQYLGPKNSQVESSTAVCVSPTTDNSALSILLQQQQMLLQWQLEFQQRNMQFVLPISSNSEPQSGISAMVSGSNCSGTKLLVAASGGATSNAKKSCLEEMRVSELREECRRLNLPRSGPKPALIERLLPHADAILGNTPNESSTTAKDTATADNAVSGIVPMDIDTNSQQSFTCKMEPSSHPPTDIPQGTRALLPVMFVPNATTLSATSGATVGLATVSSTTVPPPLVMYQPSPAATLQPTVLPDHAGLSRIVPDSSGLSKMVSDSAGLSKMVADHNGLPKMAPDPVELSKPFHDRLVLCEDPDLLLRQQQQIAQLRHQLQLSQHELVRQCFASNGNQQLWNSVPASMSPTATTQLQRTSSVLNSVMCGAFEQLHLPPVRRCFTNPFINVNSTCANSSTSNVAETAVNESVSGHCANGMMDDVIEILTQHGELSSTPNKQENSSTLNRPSFFLPTTHSATVTNDNTSILYNGPPATVANGNAGHLYNGHVDSNIGLSFDLAPSFADITDPSVDIWYSDCKPCDSAALDREPSVTVAGVDAMDMSNWLDDILPPTNTSTDCCDNVVDLFDLVDCDLCPPSADVNMRATFDKLLEVATTSKS